MKERQCMMATENATIKELLLNLGNVYHELPVVVNMQTIHPASVKDDVSIEIMMEISRNWVRQFVKWCGNLLFHHVRETVIAGRLTNIQGAIILTAVVNILKCADRQMCAPIEFIP